MSSVAAWEGERRKGLTAPAPLPALAALGLAVRRLAPVTGVKPLVGSSGVLRLLTAGVPAAAVNAVSPALFCAVG